MAELIDTRPKSVDIMHYGGDTLTIKVTAPEVLTTGMAWNAQVRLNRETATPIDATFIITPPNPPANTSAYAMLSAEDTERLARSGVLVQRRQADRSVKAVRSYMGVYDIQISDPDDPDPVITLVQGDLTLDLDVTRI